ncbi:MAG: hypothetical protein WAO91_04915 [Candidatus Nitrosotenuis sp.]
MILSKKEKPLTAYTLEKCPTCSKESKRKFKEGDVLFTESSQCDKCKTPMKITKIFGESTE